MNSYLQPLRPDIAGLFEEHGAAGDAQRLAAEVPAVAAGSLLDEIEPSIRELLQEWPTMPATVVAERIGWEHSIRILRDRVRDLRRARSDGWTA